MCAILTCYLKFPSIHSSNRTAVGRFTSVLI
jgi:hypothetical protein